jgi:tryptophan-rich sensory protein
MKILDFEDDDPKRANRRPLLLFILATLAVGALGSVVAKTAIPTWYAGLVQPSFAPPNWLFPPVWTGLYVLMAVAAWRVWRVAGLKSPAITAYEIQLALNLGWCVVFFGLHRMGAGLAEIGLSLLAILATMVLFAKADRLAGLLLLPYLLWTGFTAVLNYAFWGLNR